MSCCARVEAREHVDGRAAARPQRAAHRYPDRPHPLGDDPVEPGAPARREIARSDKATVQHRYHHDAAECSGGVAHDTLGELRLMNVTNHEVAAVDGVADREVVNRDDRVAFGSEVAGPAVERGEVGAHEGSGDDGQHERGSTQGERARGERRSMGSPSRGRHAAAGARAGKARGRGGEARGGTTSTWCSTSRTPWASTPVSCRRTSWRRCRRASRTSRPLFALESDFSDFSDFSALSGVESLVSPDSSERARLLPLRLSVRWNPEPLNTIPTGWMTLVSLPPQLGCFFSGSSENDCHASSSSPHFAHS